ncbi:MAG: pyridoxamine 5'-phosphate oxidase [Polyangiales bacterium]
MTEALFDLANPLDAVGRWMAAAAAASPQDASRVALATSTADGRPSVRYVLAKVVDSRGVCFFTSYESRKARELDANPFAALAFHWWETGGQVRLEGRVERLSAEESDAYFASRPRSSRIGAWASPQSQVLSDRDVLEARVREVEARFSGEVPRPETWGGYRLVPDAIELWQDRVSRLHDRALYTRDGDRWRCVRLAP